METFIKATHYFNHETIYINPSQVVSVHEHPDKLGWVVTCTDGRERRIKENVEYLGRYYAS